jgi:CelD/BcsL family acetyltransferase involved in cellulose biosynthesis
MKIRNANPLELATHEVKAWAAMQCANPALDSPFLRPEFTQAVAEVREDAEVAVLEVQQQPVGFFPYQRRRRIGRPVAGRLSDFQAMIAHPGFRYDPAEVLRACRLSAWHFDHLLVENGAYSPFVWRGAESPFIDLSAGFDGYMQARENGRSLRSEYGQRKRKIEREVGPLRLELDTRNLGVIATCFRWKEQQYLRTSAPNLFAYNWVRDLFAVLLEHTRKEFGVMVSTLYAGSKIAAINFCLRSNDVLHSWFPAYNVELANYSPGTLQWFELIRALPALGIKRIDLGKGPEGFKRRFMSGATQVCEGTVDLRLLPTLVRRVWQGTRDRIRASRLYGPARTPAALLYRYQSWRECQ